MKNSDYDIRYIALDSVDSTNRYAAALPAPAENEIVVVAAEEQTAGRGQGTNRWESERGKNLTFSIMCAPRFVRPARQFALLRAKALALYDVLGALVPDVTIKWPNDIYAGSRKLCGTLIECAIDGGTISRMTVGTGINVNQRVFVSDAPNPTSLALLAGRDFDRSALLRAVVERFVELYDCLRRGENLDARYAEALYRRTGEHPYRDAAGAFRATTEGIAPDGRLLLRDTLGRLRSYAFKEVEFVAENSAGAADAHE